MSTMPTQPPTIPTFAKAAGVVSKPMPTNTLRMLKAVWNVPTLSAEARSDAYCGAITGGFTEVLLAWPELIDRISKSSTSFPKRFPPLEAPDLSSRPGMIKFLEMLRAKCPSISMSIRWDSRRVKEPRLPIFSPEMLSFPVRSVLGELLPERAL